MPQPCAVSRGLAHRSPRSDATALTRSSAEQRAVREFEKLRAELATAQQQVHQTVLERDALRQRVVVLESRLATIGQKVSDLWPQHKPLQTRIQQAVTATVPTVVADETTSDNRATSEPCGAG
jgi:chromosome segregation ATPase